MTSDGQDAREAWRQLSALVLDANRKARVSEALGLSFARIRAIRRLENEPLTLKALAQKLQADPPYVTVMIGDLEQRGLVERSPHPGDARAKLVSLTAAGRKAVAEANRILDEPPAALTGLSPDELDSLLRILEKLRP